MSAPAVTLHGVSKSFGSSPALVGIDLDVAAGTILVLLGPSGAGKSTLLRLVAGLEDPDEGTITVGGASVADPKPRVPAEKRGVGMVFQTLELWPHMTVAENVAFGLEGRPRGASAARHPRVLEAAEEVGLPVALLERRPPTLSGGERQRVAIARAVAPRPPVLLYDEPLANLDPERRADIRRLVRDVRARHATTVIYVTHDPAEALEVGDDVAILVGGRLVERGAPADVYRRPRTLAGARALGAVSAVPARLRAGRSFESVLGVLEADERAGAVGGREVGHLLLRPEQVSAGSGGAEGHVVDAYPVAGGYAFTARVGGDGVVVFGRSTTPVQPGSAVRLAVTGTVTFVPDGTFVPDADPSPRKTPS